MAVNFPSSPFIGEIYTYGAYSWEWNGTYWESYTFQSSGLTGATSVGFGDSVISDIVDNILELKSFSGIGITIIDSGDTLTFSANTSPGGSVTSVSGGTGLSGNSTTGAVVLVNTAPDQTVTLTGGTNIQISGTYPNFGVNFTGTTGSNFTGGTVTGGTNFTGGLSANTFSATTYYNLPVSAVTNGTGISASTSNGTVTITNTSPDQTVTISGGTGITTGGTYPNFTLVNSLPDQTVTITGGTNVQIAGTYPNFGVNYTGQTSYPYLPLSGGTVTGGTIFQSGVTANTVSSTTVTATQLNIPLFITTAYLYGIPSTPNSLQLSGSSGIPNLYLGDVWADNTYFTSVSATTYENLPSFSGGSITGLTINGNLTVTGNTSLQGLTATTISATTYQNLPTDIRTTGGTYSNNTFTFTNNTGGTYSVLFNTVTGLTVNGGLAVTGNTLIGTTADTGSYKLDVRGATRFSATTGTSLTVISSGNSTSAPVFSVQGSQGELFSVTDSLTGSLFSVSDISGLPIMEVFSDSTIVLGDYQAPSLYTTKRVTSITASTGTTIYSFPTSAYTSSFVDYFVSGSTGLRAGNMMAIWSGSTVNFTETSTNDIGVTTPVTFGYVMSGSSAVLRASASTGTWIVESILRGL